MDSLISQISNADSFASGAWSIYFVGAFGLSILAWIVIRKLNNLVIKSILMSLVVFLCFALAKIEFDGGQLLWVPAIPYMAVDIAFQGGKSLSDMSFYLVLSAIISGVLCSALTLIGHRINRVSSVNKEVTNKKAATAHQ